MFTAGFEVTERLDGKNLSSLLKAVAQPTSKGFM